MSSFRVLALVGLFNVAGSLGSSAQSTNAAADITPPPGPTPHGNMLDFDAMAARPKSDHDTYVKVRDEAFAAYARRNPKPSSADDPAKALMRLMAYLWTWGDPYGENLWVRGTLVTQAVNSEGSTDPGARSFTQLQHTLGYGYTSGDEGAASTFNTTINSLLATDQPSAFKLWFCQAGLANIARFSAKAHPDPSAESLQPRSKFIQTWGENYIEWIKVKPSHERLFLIGKALIDDTHKDKATLDLVIAEIDRDFDQADPQNPVRLELDGAYHVEAGWSARGGGYSNSVTADGWKSFGDEMDKAASILEPLYDKYPKESALCREMMRVELGQGQGRDRMELWFKRAIAINPDDVEAYKAKGWYLQPRWYGNADTVIQFGQECADTQNWPAAIPVVFPVEVSFLQDDTLYARPDLWAKLEKVYRDYLTHYPDAVWYRTLFAKHAYDGGHKDIAREQFNILGPDWDTRALSRTTYDSIMADLKTTQP